MTDRMLFHLGPKPYTFPLLGVSAQNYKYISEHNAKKYAGLRTTNFYTRPALAADLNLNIDHKVYVCRRDHDR